VVTPPPPPPPPPEIYQDRSPRRLQNLRTLGFLWIHGSPLTYLHRLFAPALPIRSIRLFSVDRKLVASASWDKTVRLWGIWGYINRKALWSFERSYQRGQIGCLFTRWKVCCLCILGQNGQIMRWDTSTGKHCGVLKGHIREPKFHPMESLLPLHPGTKRSDYEIAGIHQQESIVEF